MLPPLATYSPIFFNLAKFLSENNNKFPFCLKHCLSQKLWVIHKHSFKPFLDSQCLQRDVTDSFESNGHEPIAKVVNRWKLLHVMKSGAVFSSQSTLPHTTFHKVDEDWMNQSQKISMRGVVVNLFSVDILTINYAHRYIKHPQLSLEQRKQHQDQDFFHLCIFMWTEGANMWFAIW